MRDGTAALAVAKQTLAYCTGADQAQVAVEFHREAYARFAHNYVTQNLQGDTSVVRVTYVRDKRIGTATSGDVSASGLQAVVTTARDLAGRLPSNPEFVSLAERTPIPASPKSVFASTKNASPEGRVATLVPVFERMRRSQLSSAGYLTSQSESRAVVNSLGVEAAFDGTQAGFEIKAIAPDVSGYAQMWSRDYAEIQALTCAELAAHNATVAKEPLDFPPGTYTVILEPPAFVECISAVIEAMTATDVLEQQDSWMIGRVGKQIFSPNLTVVDDWSNPMMANAPFDSDGAPTQQVTLIDNGVPKNYVTSTYTAHKYKKQNTGHGFDGYVYPGNAVVQPGTKSREQLIAETERGILISRMWYTRVVNPRECTITGLTRDGVYLIENGKLTKTLKNFRVFTSMLTALRDVELGNRPTLAESIEVANLHAVPVAKIAKFTLSAQTSFA